MSPFISAACKNKMEIILYNFNDSSDFERTYALYCAISNGNIEIAQFLLDNGTVYKDVDFMALNNNNRQIETVDFLFRNGMDPKKINILTCGQVWNWYLKSLDERKELEQEVDDVENIQTKRL